MLVARRARSRRQGPLDRLLTRVARGRPVAGAELRELSMGLLLRATSPVLLARSGLAVPAHARLFELSTSDRELEAFVRDDGEAKRALEESVAFLSAATPSLDAPHALGALFEGLESFELVQSDGAVTVEATRRRKRTGSFFTPAAVAEQVARAALDQLAASNRLAAPDLRVCDPACGAGAFLIETARGLLQRAEQRCSETGAAFDQRAYKRWLVESVLAGVDVDPLALRVAELSLWAFAGDSELPTRAIQGLRAGDALTGAGFARLAWSEGKGFDWPAAFGPQCRFDLVIGNPPWVAYAGRAAQPLAKERRAFLVRAYRSFRGYPTLHALFVERALELAPRGVVALLVPSPLADLDGYRAVRELVLHSHAPCEPLLEFGADVFSSVTQPCFSLIARPRAEGEPAQPARSFRLAERARLASTARSIEPPPVLARLSAAESLPRELFGEFGLQTTRVVSERLLLRADAPDGAFDYPLLEGREVQEFRVGAPRLFLHPDPEVLKVARCRLRSREDYQRVRFVIRQTAKAPIAALHGCGLPFRNTLLAGFYLPEFPPDLVVGLLNSSLYRALHLARQRDGRQSVFPQVKIAHLRSLPRPPSSSAESWHTVSALTREASENRLSRELREALDRAVFALFALDESEQREVLGFLRDRAPELLKGPE